MLAIPFQGVIEKASFQYAQAFFVFNIFSDDDGIKRTAHFIRNNEPITEMLRYISCCLRMLDNTLKNVKETWGSINVLFAN